MICMYMFLKKNVEIINYKVDILNDKNILFKKCFENYILYSCYVVIFFEIIICFFMFI